MKYIDIHCHLDFPDYDKDREEVIGRMNENGIGAITVGTDLESSKRAVEIAEQNENIWACIGMHPVQKEEEVSLFNEGEFEKLVRSPKVVAIGECGLDYFRIELGHFEAEKEIQEELFVQQIQFALKHDKPLMLHCRDSYGDVLDILESKKGEAGEQLRGNAHFFAGSVEQAKRFLDLGFTMSFTGVITFPPERPGSPGRAGTSDYDEVIKFLPISAIMSETDAPFVAPVPYRGKRNEPSFVVEVVRKIALIKGESIENTERALVENASRVFGVGK